MSPIDMRIGSESQNLENIVRDMKSYTSGRLRKAIAENSIESRREKILWMMERAGKKMAIIKGGNFGCNTINQSSFQMRQLQSKN